MQREYGELLGVGEGGLLHVVGRYGEVVTMTEAEAVRLLARLPLWIRRGGARIEFRATNDRRLFPGLDGLGLPGLQMHQDGRPDRHPMPQPPPVSDYNLRPVKP